MMRKTRNFIHTVCAVSIVCAFFASCSKSNKVESVAEDELFKISYGNFEDQLNLFNLTEVGNINTAMTMRDGFFYITNGESRKIMELNSYGDLLKLYYNEDSKPVFNADAAGAGSKYKAISFPFEYPGQITVDSRKFMYVVGIMPRDRQELDENENLLYSQVVLRFSSDGNSIDYIGQQGLGGTPFPFIRNIYTTQSDELVVLCTINGGSLVYWFSKDGFLMYKIPILTKDAPRLPEASTVADENTFVTIENVIPDSNSRKLFVKIDYYAPYIDKESKVQSGIDYSETFVYPLNVESGKYGTPVSIPPYEEAVTEDFSKQVFRLPYDFLGVTNSGWLFFIITTTDGFNVEMVQPQGQRVVKRHFDVNHQEVLYYSLSLSDAGIISALFVEKDNARVVWWRTDTLTAAILK